MRNIWTCLSNMGPSSPHLALSFRLPVTGHCCETRITQILRNNTVLPLGNRPETPKAQTQCVRVSTVVSINIHSTGCVYTLDGAYILIYHQIVITGEPSYSLINNAPPHRGESKEVYRIRDSGSGTIYIGQL